MKAPKQVLKLPPAFSSDDVPSSLSPKDQATEELSEYWFRPGHWPPRRKWPASIHNRDYRVGLTKILKDRKKPVSPVPEKT